MAQRGDLAAVGSMSAGRPAMPRRRVVGNTSVFTSSGPHSAARSLITSYERFATLSSEGTSNSLRLYACERG